VIAEVLLQRTTVAAVEGFLPNFVARYPSWGAIAEESLEELEEVLKPLGLYRRRAASLSLLARSIQNLNGKFPVAREAIEALPGVGQYIANSIEMFAHGKARPLLDVNMARVLERYFGPRKLADIRYDPYLQDLAKRVVAGPAARRVNWAILDLAALVCKVRVPDCPVCPLSKTCSTGKLILAERKKNSSAA
jgi:A/G-specific adenine glycosylase